MKALLLCAGYGRRLMPITKNTPKCMVKLGNKILLQIWIEKIIDLGIKEILINTHYLPNIINDFLKKYKNNKIKIKTTYEKKLLGTAGTLINNIGFFENQECLFIHSDNFCEDNLKKFIFSHNNRDRKCLMSMLIFKTLDPKNSGMVNINKYNILEHFDEKPEHPKGNLANGAIYILSNKFLNEVKNKPYKDFSVEIIPRFLKKINCYKTDKFFIDIGNPANYKIANARISNGKIK